MSVDASLRFTLAGQRPGTSTFLERTVVVLTWHLDHVAKPASWQPRWRQAGSSNSPMSGKQRVCVLASNDAAHAFVSHMLSKQKLISNLFLGLRACLRGCVGGHERVSERETQFQLGDIICGYKSIFFAESEMVPLFFYLTSAIMLLYEKKFSDCASERC
jgi:hypothetical protein